jgi:rod shape-determining protein MreC
LVYPVQQAAALPSNLADWAADLFQDRDELREELAVLKANNTLMAVRLQKLQSLELENNRLRELLGSSFRLQERVQVAELLRVDMDPYAQQVIIDKGLNYDVYEGQPVLDASGVMGQVMEVSQVSSRVVLLTDPSHSIPVQINRNGLRAVVTGRGLGAPLRLDYIPRHADVRVGDLLVTSGLGGRFPVGYPVGKVLAVSQPPGLPFAHIEVEPQASLATSREVMLVLPGEKVLVAPESESVVEEAEPATEVSPVEAEEENSDG